MRFPLIIFKEATPLLTPLRTLCLGRTNPRGSLVGRGFKVVAYYRGGSRVLEESGILVDFRPSVELKSTPSINWAKLIISD